MGPGYRSGGSPYRRATSATNGTADNRAGHGASPGLRKSVSQRHRRRKTKQEDQNKTLLHFHTCSLFNAFLCVGSTAHRRAGQSTDSCVRTQVGMNIQHRARRAFRQNPELPPRGY
jgi:hypothetical protein